MSLFQVTSSGLEEIPAASFAAENVRERTDLQRWLRDNPEVLGENLFVIAEEFCHWEDSRRRIDLLALDEDGNLVVIELKRTDDGGHMDLQSIRYAAMISSMRLQDFVNAFEDSLSVREPSAPVHRDEVARRMLTLWGQVRLGSRIADAIEQACDAAISRRLIIDDGQGFLTHTQAANIFVRDRSMVASAGLRKPEYIPPTELRLAITQIVSKEIGVTRDEIAAEVAKALGFSSTTAALKEATIQAVETLLKDGVITDNGGRLYLPVES